MSLDNKENLYDDDKIESHVIYMMMTLVRHKN